MTQAAAPQTYISPTYLLTSVREFLGSITYRMLADGMLLQDIRLADSVSEWADWGAFWIGRAGVHEAAGREALEKHRRVTAAGHLVRASLCAHYAQFLYFDFPEVKQEAVALKARLFREAAPLLSPPAAPLDVPYDGGLLPALLRVPETPGPHPAVILVGGLDAAKEDAHQFSELCLARGLATLAFDGPGQGEAFYRGMLLRDDFHRAISAMLDQLASDQRIDPHRIGILGRSLGGFFAPQAAALDERLRACVAWGALYDLGSFDSKPPLIREGYRFITGARDWAEAKRLTQHVTLAGTAERITCPLYVVHGMKDNSVPAESAERLAKEASGPTKLWLVPDSIHCNHDVAHLVRPDMADFLAQELHA